MAHTAELLWQLKRRRYKSHARVCDALFMRYDMLEHDKSDDSCIKCSGRPLTSLCFWKVFNVSAEIRS